MASCLAYTSSFSADAVLEAFVRLHDKGLIYRGNYLVNWAPKLQTAVSELVVCFALPLHLHKLTIFVFLPLHLHMPTVNVSLLCKMVNKHTNSVCQLTLITP